MEPNNGSSSNINDFGMPSKDFGFQKHVPVQTGSGDPLDMLFFSSSGGAVISGGAGRQQFSEVDDWGLDSEFGGSGAGGDVGGATTELEGLPTPVVAFVVWRSTLPSLSLS